MRWIICRGEWFLNRCFAALEHTSSNAGISITEVLSVFETVINILAAIVTGVCAIVGIRYINKLKDKATSATFSYWIKLRIRLSRIKNRLDANEGLLNNLFSPSVRQKWNIQGIAATDKEVTEFFSLVEETLTFMSASEDQMPAYRGWVDDYNYVLDFLDDVVRCDIRLESEKFKYNNNENISVRKQVCADLSVAIDRLIEGIISKQKEAEKKINKEKKHSSELYK